MSRPIVMNLIREINKFYDDRQSDNVKDSQLNSIILPGFISRDENGTIRYTGDNTEFQNLIFTEMDKIKINQRIDYYNRMGDAIVRMHQRQGGSTRRMRTKYRRNNKSRRTKKSKKSKKSKKNRGSKQKNYNHPIF